MSTPDRALTAWAAACAEHALARFAARATDDSAGQAITAARSWAAERRWQWAQLAPAHRARVFATEPPPPEPAACATPSSSGVATP